MRFALFDWYLPLVNRSNPVWVSSTTTMDSDLPFLNRCPTINGDPMSLQQTNHNVRAHFYLFFFLKFLSFEFCYFFWRGTCSSRHLGSLVQWDFRSVWFHFINRIVCRLLGLIHSHDLILLATVALLSVHRLKTNDVVVSPSVPCLYSLPSHGAIRGALHSSKFFLLKVYHKFTSCTWYC